MAEPQLHISAARGPLQAIRILVVDDDEPAREALKAVLEAEGGLVATAASAPAALQLADEWHPDVMIADIAMPVMDGFALVEHLRLRAPDHGGRVPVLAVTGYMSADDQTRASEAGFQAYLIKPIDPAELIATIKALLTRIAFQCRAAPPPGFSSESRSSSRRSPGSCISFSDRRRASDPNPTCSNGSTPRRGRWRSMR